MATAEVAIFVGISPIRFLLAPRTDTVAHCRGKMIRYSPLTCIRLIR